MRKTKLFMAILAIFAVVLCGCGTGEEYHQEKEVPDSAETEVKTGESNSDDEVQLGTEDDEATYSDAYQKGQEIGEKLNEEMENIDWEENYEKAEEAGKKAAEWLNGLFE